MNQRLVLIIMALLLLTGCSNSDKVVEPTSAAPTETMPVAEPPSMPPMPTEMEREEPEGSSLDTTVVPVKPILTLPMEEDSTYNKELFLILRELSGNVNYYIGVVDSGKSSPEDVEIIKGIVDRACIIPHNDAYSDVVSYVNSTLLNLGDCILLYDEALRKGEGLEEVVAILDSCLEDLYILSEVFGKS